MYLMRSKRWSAQQARAHCIAARSLVSPNDGFWQTLCALEGPLGILDRCALYITVYIFMYSYCCAFVIFSC
jgi:dual specificity MAP kinase phosphatase